MKEQNILKRSREHHLVESLNRVDRVGAVPKRLTLAVQTVGLSNAVSIDNNLVDVYQLPKAKFGLTPFNSVKNSITTLDVRSLPGVPASPLAPEQGMTW